MSAVLCALSTLPVPASARIGGIAQRGDNCTPINLFAVGFPAPGGTLPAATVVDQKVLLDRGWRTIGFILTSRDGTVNFAPFNIATSHEDGSYNVPTVFPVESLRPDAILAWYPRIRATALANGFASPGDFVAQLQIVTVAPCYTASLP